MGARSSCQPPGSWLGLGLAKTTWRDQKPFEDEGDVVVEEAAEAGWEKVGMAAYMRVTRK